ncbi:MAG: recombination-associated protein RdgC [Burkholderiales bacterium]|nr:MAG: recombination-associated protein RdgC [Burkholderiales bacterium]TAG77039.1 MAG: recombination-associated protein RdgC [Betaproteobacteria bacterium]
MFKNLIIYRITDTWDTDLAKIEENLKSMPFMPCGATQDTSMGWAPPRGQAHGALVESVAGQWILRLQVETKILPSSVVKRRAEERAQQIEGASGKKLSRMAVKDLREQTMMELLPRAFTKLASVPVWIDPEAKLVMIEAASPAKADEVAVLLLSSLDGLAISPLQTQKSPTTCMSAWLHSFDPPHRFGIDRECELKAIDETQAIVRYARHNIEIEEVKRHIQNGKMATKLALTWADRVSFMLTETLQIKKIKLLEAVMEGNESQDEGEDHFDGDVAIMTGELAKMIPDMIEALGGELVE